MIQENLRVTAQTVISQMLEGHKTFADLAERYIAEIEENIKEMKKEKVKTKKIYTFKQGSLEGYPQLKKILENKAISELIYR